MFINKYTPQCVDDSLFHKDKLDLLDKMSKDNSVPHIIFYGPSGSGKKTIIKLFLEMLYGKDVHNINDTIYKVSGSGNVVTDVIIKQSNYHIEIEPNNNNFDRYLIQDVVKEYAKKMPLNVLSTKKTFKTVLINNADNLPHYAQTSLRRTMEKLSGTCRFIMWCTSLSSIIGPIRSRCYRFRIPSPLPEEMFEMLLTIAYKEKISMQLHDYNQIIYLADGNIKKALWLLQLKKYNMSCFTSYDKILDDIVKLLLKCDTGEINKVRELIYEITTTNIGGSQIIRDLTAKLVKSSNINNVCKLNVAEISARTEHNLIKCRREIMHIEAFIVGVLCMLHKYGTNK